MVDLVAGLRGEDAEASVPPAKNPLALAVPGED
jgi:hypothetical protein